MFREKENWIPCCEKGLMRKTEKRGGIIAQPESQGQTRSFG